LKTTNRLALCCTLLLLLAPHAAAQKGQKGAGAKADKIFYTEGVFSDIKAGEGGDYGGMQVYLTDSDGQFYAVVTVAEGVLHPPVLVKAQVDIDSRKVAFSLPGEDGGRKFTGQVTADALTLTEEGGEKRILKRKCY
jgi:hypothetical protein